MTPTVHRSCPLRWATVDLVRAALGVRRGSRSCSRWASILRGTLPHVSCKVWHKSQVMLNFKPIKLECPGVFVLPRILIYYLEPPETLTLKVDRASDLHRPRTRTKSTLIVDYYYIIDWCLALLDIINQRRFHQSLLCPGVDHIWQ